MSKKIKKIQDLEDKIIGNVENDRDDAGRLLVNIHDFLGTRDALGGEEYSKIMASAAKVVENLQKSNEQILRILESLNRKKIVEETNELTKEEIENIWKQESVETITVE